MFDLEAAIADWKSELARGPACAGPDADELESHLRESVARLASLGLTSEESFLLALRRLGQPAGLQVEYAKAHPERVWRDRAVWMLTGVAAIAVLSALSNIVGMLGLFVAVIAGAQKYVLGGAAISSDVIGLAIAATAAIFLYRRAVRGQFQFRPMMLVITVIVAILVGFVSQLSSPYFLVKFMSPSNMKDYYISTALPLLCYHAIVSIVLPLAYMMVAIRLHRTALRSNC